MQDATARLEKLRTDAAECDMIAKLATNSAKSETFRRLADAYEQMASDLEELIKAGKIPGEPTQ